MKRVVILGRGGSGKSNLASKLGEITGLQVIELDKTFLAAGTSGSASDRMGEDAAEACRARELDHGWRLGALRRS